MKLIDQQSREERENSALIRELLAPALNADVRLRTSDGTPVTLESLPCMARRGSKIQMIDDTGRLAAITLADEQEPDTKRLHEFLPSWEQIRHDGRRDRFFLLPGDMEAIAIEGYRPAMLDLNLPIDAIRWNDARRVHRVPANRAKRIFRHLLATG